LKAFEKMMTRRIFGTESWFKDYWSARSFKTFVGNKILLR
jgi:hypothetical protein